ncbi:hypothetical protein GCM10010508_48140 [Streptomyces naganishii JCM 4654]|uniref:Uncharacterized protein n=1 Tax=Streptomyces naganishii JCM 4654 TaxID=1306179 RepID=A0A919CXM4_9ACTN|nr:hypothetical protein GCM10010508_48140 [Streptomyces naganishii JCM 4654]
MRGAVSDGPARRGFPAVSRCLSGEVRAGAWAGGAVGEVRVGGDGFGAVRVSLYGVPVRAAARDGSRVI